MPLPSSAGQPGPGNVQKCVSWQAGWNASQENKGKATGQNAPKDEKFFHIS
jgi:hypothetical protein